MTLIVVSAVYASRKNLCFFVNHDRRSGLRASFLVVANNILIPGSQNGKLLFSSQKVPKHG